MEEEKSRSKEQMEDLGMAKEEDLERLWTMYEERREELKWSKEEDECHG